jgi:hypothetical protein
MVEQEARRKQVARMRVTVHLSAIESWERHDLHAARRTPTESTLTHLRRDEAQRPVPQGDRRTNLTRKDQQNGCDPASPRDSSSRRARVRGAITVDQSGKTMVLPGAGTWAPNKHPGNGDDHLQRRLDPELHPGVQRLAASNAPANSQIVTTSPSNTEPGNGSSRPAHVFADVILLSSGKTVRSITLPTVSDGIVGPPQVALHAFALGVG